VRLEYRGTSTEASAVIDGMTLELTRLLARAEGLEVYAPRSLPANRETSHAGAGVGLQRAADLVLSGSVSGGDAGAWRQAEISLIRARSSESVWSETFSLSDGDIMSVQQRIADAVVEALGLSVTEQQQHWVRPPLQEMYLKARVLQSSASDRARQHAAELYRHIIREVPTFVPARAALVTAEAGVSKTIRTCQ
jgi:TolB-like protein